MLNVQVKEFFLSVYPQPPYRLRHRTFPTLQKLPKCPFPVCTPTKKHTILTSVIISLFCLFMNFI